MQRELRLLLSTLLVLFLVIGCSDSETEDPTDTSTGGDTGAVDTGADVTADTGTEDTGTEDTGTGDTGTEDTGEPRGTCGHLPPQDETALYDLTTPLQKFVGQANVSRAGTSVSVNIIDETDEFVGDFMEEFGNCVLVDVDTLSADLCFYNADGTPAEDHSLGANLFGFIHGAQHVNPSATLIGAVRQGVDRSCSPGGWYLLELGGDMATTGDLPAEATTYAEAEYLTYLGIFDLGDERVSAVIGVEEPLEEPLRDGDPIGGEIDIRVPTGFAVEIDESDVDFDLDYELVGIADFDAGTITGTITLSIENDTNSGEISASVTLNRQ